jgi:hypothetical protein
MSNDQLSWLPEIRCSHGSNSLILHIAGSYEYPPSGYKHIYFNATFATLKICLLSVACVLAAYETIRHLYNIARYSRIRPTMLLLVLVSIYPHYYTWWSYFSYLNEQFYDHWYHDMFFSITEWISTIVALHLCDVKNEFTTWKLLIIISINIVHVFVAGLDQFAVHVILKKGFGFQNARNLGLMIPDWVFVIVSFYELFKMMREKNLKLTELFYKEEIAVSIIFVLIATILINNI